MPAPVPHVPHVPPTQALRHLAAFLHDSGSRLSVEQAATIAIQEWIEQAASQLERRGQRPRRSEDVLANTCLLD